MLTLIHGTDIVASRKYFLEKKAEISGSEFLKGSLVNLTDLCQSLEGSGLFESARTLFIEQLLTEKKKSVERDAIISYLIRQAKSHSIFLWEGKDLDRAVLSLFKEASVKSYKLSSSLFTFLDGIKPNNGAQLMQLFHKSLETSDAGMIFFMLIRQFRILLALSDKGEGTITEISRLAPWQKGKFEKQVSLFKKDHLLQLYSRLFQIELAQKTGALSSSLISTIDFFLLEI
ncbi:hypothetical protein KKF69_07045 [Patescibacteria group bacterium]|nr:hypothetical protein [Patescibacteria group bacterium]